MFRINSQGWGKDQTSAAELTRQGGLRNDSAHLSPSFFCLCLATRIRTTAALYKHGQFTGRKCISRMQLGYSYQAVSPHNSLRKTTADTGQPAHPHRCNAKQAPRMKQHKHHWSKANGYTPQRGLPNSTWVTSVGLLLTKGGDVRDPVYCKGCRK